MGWDSGFGASQGKQPSPAGPGAELCIAVKLKCLCSPLHTRSDGLFAGSVYISGSVFTVPVSVCASMASFCLCPFHSRLNRLILTLDCIL